MTQNVDGLLAAAGCENVVEIHGNMSRLRCVACQDEIPTADFERSTQREFSTDADVPRCNCGGVLRPNVVLFGEQLPDRAVATWMEQWERGFDLVLSVGTSSQFPYILQPIYEGRSRGIPTVEINPSETSVSWDVDYRLDLDAAKALPAIWRQARTGGA